jgi:glutaredoxin-related protein
MRPTLDEAKVHPAARSAIESYQADLLSRVKELVAKHDLVVVGMTMNPFPGRARRLLEEKGIAYEYLGIGSYLSGWRQRLVLKLWTGWVTFPMIFVKGTFIGGFQDLKRLIDQNELQALLNAQN